MMQAGTIFLVILSSFAASARSQFLLDLNGDWLVKDTKKGSAAYPARVPGNIYTDLWRNGTLKEDPYYRFNDEEYRWVSKEDWSFWRTFSVPASVLNYNRVLLKCEGIDTVAAVYMNNKSVGASNNQFIQYYFDIKDALVAGNNEVTFRFRSPTAFASEQFYKHIWDRAYAVPPVCPVPEFHGECHPNFIRKAQSSFSWDWGPAFPTVGIWKNISVVAYNTAYLEGVAVNTSWTASSDTWKLTVVTHLLTTSQTPKGLISISVPELGLQKTENVILQPDRANYTFTYDIQTQVEKWWPNGYGSQKLYNVSVAFSTTGGITESVKAIRAGFRQVELVQEKLPQANVSGLTFYFRINGIPIWAKGSNWIPAHSFQDAVTNGYVEWLLQSSVLANMNMLRVWGGGYYESEYFYQLCDELGILIWQDFMFACAMYPTTDDFLVSVREEVRDNIIRLQHHASIVIWSANNENEAALVTNWYGTSLAYEKFRADYVKLYIDVIRDETLKTEIAGSRPWVASSPSDGLLTEEEGWLSQNPYSNLFGDVHFYSYLVNPWDWKIYPPTRFASEYGFQSWESIETLQRYSDPSDLSYYSKFANNRQHHPLGQIEMLYEIAKNFKLPNPVMDHDKFPALVYLTQINQAMGIKTETEFYRRMQQTVNADSSGWTQGALFWQLNSIWACPSWSSIEFGGKWKMMHYYAKDFFEPVLLSPYIDKDQGMFHVSLINDHLFPINNTMRLQVFNFGRGFQEQSRIDVPVSLKAQGASIVYNEVLTKLTNRSGCTKAASCFVVVSLVQANGNCSAVPNVFFLGSPKDTRISRAKVQVLQVANGKSANSFDITLQSDNIAPFVWLEVPRVLGYFSKNGHTQYFAQDQIQFTAKTTTTADYLRKNLKVMSLMDIY